MNTNSTLDVNSGFVVSQNGKLGAISLYDVDQPASKGGGSGKINISGGTVGIGTVSGSGTSWKFTAATSEGGYALNLCNTNTTSISGGTVYGIFARQGDIDITGGTISAPGGMTTMNVAAAEALLVDESGTDGNHNEKQEYFLGNTIVLAAGTNTGTKAGDDFTLDITGGTAGAATDAATIGVYTFDRATEYNNTSRPLYNDVKVNITSENVSAASGQDAVGYYGEKYIKNTATSATFSSTPSSIAVTLPSGTIDGLPAGTLSSATTAQAR